MRKQPLVQSHQKDGRKLESLGRVHGHEGDPVSVGTLPVLVGRKRHVVQKFGEGPLAVKRRGVEKLLHVFDPRGVVPEPADVVREVEKFRHDPCRGAALRLAAKFAQKRREFPEPLDRVASKKLFLLALLHGVERSQSQRPRDFEHALHRHLSYSPLRNVGYSREAGDVPGIADQAQVGEQVLYLGPLVKARAGDHDVGNSGGAKRLLHRSGLEARPVENRRVAEAEIPRIRELRNPPGNERRLLDVVFRAEHDGLLPAGIFRPESFFLPAEVFPYDSVRYAEHGPRGTVVLLELHGFRLAEVPLEVQYVAYVRPPPSVDRLAVVAHHEKVLAEFRKSLDEPVLVRVCVLVLVHEHVGEHLLVAAANLGSLA